MIPFLQQTKLGVDVNIKPIWKLGQADGDSIEFDLILFNDEIERAIRNFKFVHTVIPNNMWM